MYQDNFQNRKKNEDRKKRVLEIIILILILISAALSIYIVIRDRDEIFAQENRELLEVKDLSDEEMLPYIEEYEGDYTELMGYGCLTITSKRPYVYLENMESNDVYLKFDVFNEEELLYSSKLIQPGDFDSLNVYEKLSNGNYILTYKVTTFDINTQAQLMSLIQEQEINIIGG